MSVRLATRGRSLWCRSDARMSARYVCVVLVLVIVGRTRKILRRASDHRSATTTSAGAVGGTTM